MPRASKVLPAAVKYPLLQGRHTVQEEGRNTSYPNSQLHPGHQRKLAGLLPLDAAWLPVLKSKAYVPPHSALLWA